MAEYTTKIVYITKEQAKNPFYFLNRQRPSGEIDYPEWCAIVDELQPADVSPVVHGMWEDCTDDAGYWKCSNCEEPWVLLEGTPAENKMHYCPNCGAKMDLED